MSVEIYHSVIREKVPVNESAFWFQPGSNPMQWSDELPTVPGWYWWRNRQQPGKTVQVVYVNEQRSAPVKVGEEVDEFGRVTEIYDAVLSSWLELDGQPVSCYDAEWAGPIPEPGERYG